MPASSCTWSAWTVKSTNNGHTALLKAQTALKTRQPTSINAAQLKNNPGRPSAFYRLF
jgi:hypothetical protein